MTVSNLQASSDRFAADAGQLPALGTVAPSAAYTASADYLVTVKNGTGLVVIMNATAKASSPSVVLTVRGYDPATGSTWDIAAATALTDTGARVLRIHPSLAVADCKYNDIVPEHVVIHVEASNSNALTYSIQAIVTP